MKQAIILAGGQGTRLRERLGQLPKPLIDICGVPLLERQITLLKTYGFTKILVLVNYEAQKIIEFCNSRDNWGIQIDCINDGQALGTAGAVLGAWDQLDHEFLVVYGDTMLDVDLSRFVAHHRSHNQAAATLFLHPNDHPHDSDLVEMREDGRILALHAYPHPTNTFLPNLVNAALYVIRKASLKRYLGKNKPVYDFGKHLFPEMLQNNDLLVGYNSLEYIKDSGTPARLDKVCSDFQSGKIAQFRLSTPQKVVFLDRDGTINVERSYISTPEQLDLINGSASAIKQLNTAGWRVCVITNQPVIARGECTPEELRQIHNKMETLLGHAGAFVDRIAYCPHHPDSGYEGEVISLKIQCLCRKPRIGMIEKLTHELNIDIRKSWLIGDSTSDIMTAKNAGLRSILVRTGLAGLDGKYQVEPDYSATNLQEAVSMLLESEVLH